MDAEQTLKTYSISSAKKGHGNQNGRFQTPLGQHKIKLKIGHGCPSNTVFVGRQATGEIYNDALALQYPNRDWILSRLLWLQGLELGHNLGGQCDSSKRFIYIHGTPDSEPMGQPQSHGCIRMRNHDIIDLFSLVQNHTAVEIIL